MAHLYDLRLSKSALKYLPNSIGNLIHLRNLDVSSTKLDSLPYYIGNLHNLLVLNVYGSNIQTLPSAIRLLPQLSCISVEMNFLSIIPEGFGEELMVASLPNIFGNFPILKKSKVPKTPKSMDPRDLFPNPPISKKWEERQNTKLTPLPDFFGNICNLENVYSFLHTFEGHLHCLY